MKNIFINRGLCKKLSRDLTKQMDMLNIDNQILEASEGGLTIIEHFTSFEKVINAKSELKDYGTSLIVSKRDGLVSIKEYDGKKLKRTYPTVIDFVARKRRCTRWDAYSKICVRLDLKLVDLIEKSILELTDGGKDLVEGWARLAEGDYMENKYEIVSYNVPVTEIVYKDAIGNLVTCDGVLDFAAKVNNKGKLGALEIVMDSLFLSDIGTNYDEYERMSERECNCQ